MRILYHHRIASRDGQATHVEGMIRGLRDAGHEVTECGPDVYKQDTGEGGSAGWVGRLKATLPQPLYELAELAYSAVAYRRLSREIRSMRPDAIYERYALFNLAGVWAARRYRIPLLLEVNAPVAVERRKYIRLKLGQLADHCEAYAWRGATRVLPVTAVLAETIQAAGVPSSRIIVIPNAVDPRDYVGLPSQAAAKEDLGLGGRLIVGFTGFVSAWDRLERVISWLGNYRGSTRVHLMVIGDGPVRCGLEAQARELGVEDRVTFTGIVPRSEVPRLATAFDIALQTALVPWASPLCLFEYLALGKAIVAPDQPNHREVLRPGIDALLYRPDDEADLERAIERLVEDTPLRERLAAGAGAAISARGYTWTHHAERVIEVILESRQALVPMQSAKTL